MSCSSGELGDDFSADMSPSDVNEKLAARIHQLFKEAHFDSVTADCLSPAGEYNLRLGVMKEMKPDLVATSQVVIAEISKDCTKNNKVRDYQCARQIVFKSTTLYFNLGSLVFLKKNNYKR